MIARDDAAAVRLFRQAALHDELVRRENELPEPGRSFSSECFVFFLPSSEQFHFAIGALGCGCFSIQQSIRFHGRNERHACASLQFCTEQRGKQAIFAVLESSCGFFAEITAEVPLVAGLAGPRNTVQIEGSCTIKGLYLDAML